MEATQIAEYILSLTDEDSGDAISNLKLQKLLYYCQGFHLAMHGTPMFTNDIEAWQHGPVVPEVYRKYRSAGSKAIPIPEQADLSPVMSNPDLKQIIDEVYNVYGQYSAWKLRDMTHNESPWLKTTQNEVIKHELMKEYFETQLV